MEKILNYIDGAMVGPESGCFFPAFEPATGQAYAEIPDSGAEDVARAVSAAQRAFPDWSRRSAFDRAQMLRALSERVTNNQAALARAESVDTGKPLSVANSVDIPRSVLNLSFFADAITQFSSECHPSEGMLNYTLRPPLGVVGCISPWNLPLYLLTWKIAPALAAGNCVVAKPSEITPMTAMLLSKLSEEVGLPKGVLNIVHGYGDCAGSFLCTHPEVRAISFTGSTKTGRKISEMAAPQFKKLSLEMGGKNPFIVFNDADLEPAVSTAIRAAFSNQGQICLCGSRVYVESEIYERFKEIFVKRTSLLKVGDPLEEQVDLGAVVSQAHLQKILAYVELAREEKGKILCGGKQTTVSGRCRHGWFVEPTVIENLPTQCRTNQEEIFGPVVTLMPFDGEEAAIREANAVPYGLSASVWTSNLTRAHRVAARLECGIVWINSWMARDLRTPFGGTKQSGVGREGGLEALRFYTEPKNVCLPTI